MPQRLPSLIAALRVTSAHIERTFRPAGRKLCIDLNGHSLEQIDQPPRPSPRARYPRGSRNAPKPCLPLAITGSVEALKMGGRRRIRRALLASPQRNIRRVFLLHADQVVAGVDVVGLARDAARQARQQV